MSDLFSGIMPSSSAVCTPETARMCMAGATASDCPNPPMQQSWMGQEAFSMAQSMGLSTWEMEMGDNLPGSIWPHVFWPVCFARQYCPTVAGATVEITLIASGSVSDYSDTLILQLKSRIAIAAGVDESLVTIRVTAASVRITATIAVPAYTTADVLQALLSSSFGTADAASTALGVTIEEVPTITFESAAADSDSSSALTVPLIVGIAAGALVFGGLLTAGACVMVHRRHQQNTPGMLKQAGVPDPEASTAQLNHGSL